MPMASTWSGRGQYSRGPGRTDLAGGRGQQPADDVEQRRLAGAVRADERVDAAASDLARDIVKRQVAAEALADASTCGAARSSCHRGARSSPSGRQIATTTSSAPKKVMRQSWTKRSNSGSRVTIAAPTTGPSGLAGPPSTT